MNRIECKVGDLALVISEYIPMGNTGKVVKCLNISTEHPDRWDCEVLSAMVGYTNGDYFDMESGDIITIMDRRLMPIRPNPEIVCIDESSRQHIAA